jgi:hypothetical protein
MSQIKVNSIVDASGGNTATINTYTPTESNMPGYNRIINGDMRIDQRNAGASVTASNINTITYTLDRWAYFCSQASKFTLQQNAASVTPPVKFSNYLGITSSSAYSVLTGDYFFIRQYIEGFNFADAAFGTANATTITLSFWIRSSLTGTFAGSLTNSAADRSYPFTYTISAANTWEYKTITIAGDTTGTWVGATNGAGAVITFSLGTGSTFSGTAGAWAAGNFISVTGATSVVGTLNATWYITGVQLEVGSVATPFERRDYGRELAMCQRYYWLAVKGQNKTICTAAMYDATQTLGGLVLPVTMRTTPALDIVTGTNYYSIERNGASDTFDSFTIYRATENIAGLFTNSGVSGTAGHAGLFECKNAASFIGFTSEL